MSSSRGRLTLLVAALVIGVIPAAYAGPPDPSWVAGYWDDDDFDTTVVFITGACAIDVVFPVHSGPFLVALARVERAGPVDCPTPLRAARHPRAPPATS